ncbi:MAG: glycosyltransferase [Acidimicrobiia bacterium]
MRIGVYDRYWDTLGGGEQFAGGIAEALAKRHDVDAVGPLPIDKERTLERLGVDLTNVTTRIVGDHDSALSAASADYDLFVNCTYLSGTPSLARHGLYIVHFPGTGITWRSEQEARIGDAVGRARREPQLYWREGFHPAEHDGAQRWTNGFGGLLVRWPSGGRLEIDISGEHWPGELSAHCRVQIDDRIAFDGELPRDGAITLTTDVPVGNPALMVVFKSDAFVPHEVSGVPDIRQLGTLITGIRANGRTVTLGGSTSRFRALALDRYAILPTYGTVASNSEFTREWVKRWCGRESDVLYPPVHMQRRAPKDKTILSIGRFFDAESGHSKKQFELVQAFRKLVDSGVRDWTLHFIGGCDRRNREYAAAVRREARGLPVAFHFNAPGEDLRDLVGKASIYWHGGGFGEDESRTPERFEHFGISVVEAMSAGAVPVVFGAAGPREIVRSGTDGFHFRTLDELAARTRQLIEEPATLARMATSCAERASYFGFERFEDRLNDLVDRILGGPAVRRSAGL